jgi:hypothetical protein
MPTLLSLPRSDLTMPLNGCYNDARRHEWQKKEFQNTSKRKVSAFDFVAPQEI